jgi:hypothetical protein
MIELLKLRSKMASGKVSTAPLSSVVVGYPKLATKIELQPELSIYRRFGALNAQNLLYYQAELVDLEESLKKQQTADNSTANSRKSKYAKSWYKLQDSDIDGDTEQLDLVLKVRKTLKEYSKYYASSTMVTYDMQDQALIQQHVIHTYAKPTKWELHTMQNYLQNRDMEPPALLGDDGKVWGSYDDRKSHKPDLITLCPRRNEDPFSMWAADNTILNLFRCGCARFMKPSRVHGVVGYEDSTIYRITYWITSILASLIPIASIVVLYCVHSMPARLGVIAVFNVLVSVCLIGLANAKRAEVFAITAA